MHFLIQIRDGSSTKDTGSGLGALGQRRCQIIEELSQGRSCDGVSTPGSSPRPSDQGSYSQCWGLSFHEGRRRNNDQGPFRSYDCSPFLIMRFQDYYEEKYGYRLRYPRLFGICVNVQQKTIVPAEVCTIVGGQMYKKVLMPEMMSEVLQQVTKNPRERIEAIERGVNGDVSLLILLIMKRSFDVGRCSSSTTKTRRFSLRLACKLTFAPWKLPLACFYLPTSSTRGPSPTFQSKHRR